MAYAQIRCRGIHAGDINGTDIHNNREFKDEKHPDNIDLTRTINNRYFTSKNEWRDANTKLKDIIEDRLNELEVCGIRKNSVVAIEVVVSVSDANFFQSYDSHGYGMNEMKWLEDDFFGEGNVVAGWMHMDESKPHWHFLCIPAKEKEFKFKNRYGSGSRKEMRLCAQDYLGGKKKLSSLQKRYFEHCKDRYGHIVPFWSGLKAEEQKREYIQKTSHLIEKYKQQADTLQKAADLARESVGKVAEFEATIQRQKDSRRMKSYQWDKNAKISEWNIPYENSNQNTKNEVENAPKEERSFRR